MAPTPIVNLRHWLRDRLVHLHLLIFKVPPGQNMRTFMRGLGWSVLSGGIASILMMAINILSGRILGPTGYGIQNIVLTVATILSTIATFGLGNASIRELAISTTDQRRRQIIASTYFPTTMLALVLATGFLLAAPFLQSRFGLNQSAYLATALLAIILTSKITLDGFIRGLDLFVLQAKIRLAEVASACLVFVAIFYWIQGGNNLGYIWMLIISGGIASALYWGSLRRFFGPIHRSTLKSLFSYGQVLFLGTVLGTVFNNLDKFIIAKYLSLEQLGLYSAYYAASTNLIAQVVQMFINVFFPSVARNQQKLMVVRKIDRLFLLGSLPLLLGLIAIIGSIMFFFGSAYASNPQYIVLFSFLGLLQFFYTVYSFIITSIDATLYKQFMRETNIVNLVHLGAYLGLIQLAQVSIVSIVLLYIVNVGLMIHRQRQMLYQRLLPESEMPPTDKIAPLT